MLLLFYTHTEDAVELSFFFENFKHFNLDIRSNGVNEMGLVKRVIISIVLILLIYIGYVGYAVMTLQPQGRAEWGYVDKNSTEVWITLNLGKPLLVPFNVKSLSIKLENIPFIKVERFEYHATDKFLKMVIAIDNKKMIQALVAYLNNGNKGNIEIDFSGQALGVIPIKYSAEEPINVNPLEYINLTAKSEEIGPFLTPAIIGSKNVWGGVEGNKAVIYTYLKMYNPNSVPIPVTGISFKLYMNDIQVGEGKIAETVIVPAKGYATAKVKTEINLDSLPEVWVKHIKQGEASIVKAEIYLNITAGQFKYTHKLRAVEKKIETNIMGDINDILTSLR